MPKRSSKRPKVNEVEVRTGTDTTAEDFPKPQGERAPPRAKNPAAVALGRMGGEKGGKARAAKLSAEERTAIAKKAAAKRWETKRDVLPPAE